jgi:hypothetical protein
MLTKAKMTLNPRIYFGKSIMAALFSNGGRALGKPAAINGGENTPQI